MGASLDNDLAKKNEEKEMKHDKIMSIYCTYRKYFI